MSDYWNDYLNKVCKKAKKSADKIRRGKKGSHNTNDPVHHNNNLSKYNKTQGHWKILEKKKRKKTRCFKTKPQTTSYL